MNSYLPHDVQAAWVISRWVADAIILGKMSACYPPPCQRKNIEEIRYAWWSHYFSRKSQSVCSLLTLSGSCSQDVSVSSQPGYLVLNNQWAWYTKASFQLGVVLEWLTHFLVISNITGGVDINFFFFLANSIALKGDARSFWYNVSDLVCWISLFYQCNLTVLYNNDVFVFLFLFLSGKKWKEMKPSRS